MSDTSLNKLFSKCILNSADGWLPGCLPFEISSSGAVGADCVLCYASFIFGENVLLADLSLSGSTRIELSALKGKVRRLLWKRFQRDQCGTGVTDNTQW